MLPCGWADQGIKTPVKKNLKEYGSIAKDDPYLRVSAAGWDGITDSYRRPTRDFWETKAVYCPVWPEIESIDYEKGNKHIMIPIYNGYDFTNLDAVTIEWSLCANGRVIDSSKETLRAAPHTSAKLDVSTIHMITRPNESVYVLLAMLGRVYLTLSGFPYYESYETEATELFKIIIDYSAAHSNKWWAPNMTEWNKQWIHENDNKYPIFEIQYAMTQGMGNPMTPYCSGNMQPYTDWAKKGFLVADVSMITPDDLIKHFTTEPETDADGNEYVDQRGPMTFSGFELNEQGEYDEGTEGNQFNIKFIEYIKKRATLGYATIDDQMVDRTCWPQNFPIIRFEDVLLMYAELVGPTTDGYAAINRIRTRAGLPALSGLSADDFQQAVRRERQYELAGEGQRWHDLVRWNVYVDTMKKVYADTPYAAFVKAESYLYPIPWVQMKVREGLYEQNPGY